MRASRRALRGVLFVTFSPGARRFFVSRRFSCLQQRRAIRFRLLSINTPAFRYCTGAAHKIKQYSADNGDQTEKEKVLQKCQSFLQREHFNKKDLRAYISSCSNSEKPHILSGLKDAAKSDANFGEILDRLFPVSANSNWDLFWDLMLSQQPVPESIPQDQYLGKHLLNPFLFNKSRKMDVDQTAQIFSALVKLQPRQDVEVNARFIGRIIGYAFEEEKARLRDLQWYVDFVSQFLHFDKGQDIDFSPDFIIQVAGQVIGRGKTQHLEHDDIGETIDCVVRSYQNNVLETSEPTDELVTFASRLAVETVLASDFPYHTSLLNFIIVRTSKWWPKSLSDKMIMEVTNLIQPHTRWVKFKKRMLEIVGLGGGKS